jgi:hypothetical protein
MGRKCDLSFSRQFAAALAAIALFATAAPAETKASGNGCPSEVAVLASPMVPSKNAPLRVVVAAEEELDGELSLVAPNQKIAAVTPDRHGGPPYDWTLEVHSPAVGTWQAILTRKSAPVGCQTVTHDIVVKRSGQAASATKRSVWPIRQSWNRETENLYSAWVETLFDAPIEEELSWPALDVVLRDKSRNLLFNHLGLREDEKGLAPIKPDCADLPYFLRAYFAFKMGLPYGYAKCTRGGSGAPRCTQWWNIEKEEPPPAPEMEQAAMVVVGPFGFPVQRPPQSMQRPPAPQQQRPQALVPGFAYYLRNMVANGVQSGNGRTAANDEETDYYPVPLKQETLRPGTVYADPYGHMLVLAKRVAQTKDGAGVFLAVDAQPDGTVARKRFWRGNFLFAQDPSLGSAGFKRFRPIERAKNGNLVRLSNERITEDADYADFSLEQSQLSVEAFYDRMDDVMSPQPLEPVRALKEAVTALEEQVQTRVTSVENGRKFQKSGKGIADMPDGPAIFETSGAWEDFATPSRDLRILIAMDVVNGFPDRVARRPERYAMPQGKSVDEVKAELKSALAAEVASRKFTYTRSDGSDWTLTLKDVLDRAAALEMAYNPNDCVELRWGATEGSDEAKTCKLQAPQGQRAKMEQYRDWFHERRRPPRGDVALR